MNVRRTACTGKTVLWYYVVMLSDIEFRILLDTFERPWNGFRRVRKGVKKRVRRHMENVGLQSIDSYIELLNRSPEERWVFESCMRVTVSRFFRDRDLWYFLAETILPELGRKFTDGLNIWSIGCSNGEEVYTIAILLDHYWPGGKHSVLATDVDQGCLDRALTGIYGKSSLREVPDDIRQRYFERRGGKKYAVKNDLRQCIRWLNHDLFSEPPGRDREYHLVFLRNNLLTYFQGETVYHTLATILRKLARGGYLVVGRNERISDGTLGLTPVEASNSIYRLEETA